MSIRSAQGPGHLPRVADFVVRFSAGCSPARRARVQTEPVALVIKRVYEPALPTDGYRVLVDRLWPRGVSKARAALDEWAKEVAPSPELRSEWHHHRERFDEFADRYRSELDESALDDQGATRELLGLGETHDRVTLLFGAHDERVNHAVVLLDWLAEHGATVER